jgi:predicted Rossmann-fold nucleotide-binding protein
MFGSGLMSSSGGGAGGGGGKIDTNLPNLIEPQAKNYLFHTLTKCHDMRVKYNTVILNIGVFLAFVGVFGGILYYLYKTKSTPQQNYNKMMKDQEYILSKIRFYQEQKQKIDTAAAQSASAITDLPILPNVMGLGV